MKTSKSILLTGGHYVLRNGVAALNEPTLHSFECALRARAVLSCEYAAAIGILVNDIGIACTGSVCSMDRGGPSELVETVPDAFKALLDLYGVSTSELVLISERYLRNRAQKLVKKHLGSHPSLVLDEFEGRVWLEPRQGGDCGAAPGDRSLGGDRIVLTRPSTHCYSGTPACPAIMAAFVAEHSRLGYRSSINIYNVDYANFENIPNYLSIEEGRIVAEELALGTAAANIFITSRGVAVSKISQADRDLLRAVDLVRTTAYSDEISTSRYSGAVRRPKTAGKLHGRRSIIELAA